MKELTAKQVSDTEGRTTWEYSAKLDGKGRSGTSYSGKIVLNKAASMVSVYSQTGVIFTTGSNKKASTNAGTAIFAAFLSR